MKDIHEYNLLSFVHKIMTKTCPRSFEKYFQKRQNVYDVHRKDQLVAPFVKFSLREKALRVTGASLWNNLHKDMMQHRLMKSLKGELKKYYISKNFAWCIYRHWSCCVVIYQNIVMEYDNTLHCSILKKQTNKKPDCLVAIFSSMLT